MFARIVYAACAAGLAAGLVLSVLQSRLSTPLILEAETYEAGPASTGPGAAAGSHEPGQHGHEGHGDPTWAPADGFERRIFTGIANIGLAIGFGLLLCALFAVHPPLAWWHGLAWGLAGYFVFFVSPALGLPPRLPGHAGADLVARQGWWLAAAASAAAGILLVVRSRGWPLRLLGVAVIVAPHAWGAPPPPAPVGEEMLALERQFAIASYAVNAAFWLVLGGVSALGMRHLARAAR